MKTAIIYYSKHHGNTKKLLDAIAAEDDITFIDVTDHPVTELSDYERIGFASGIYYQSFHKSILEYAKKYLPEKKNVFFLFTYGVKRKGYLDAIRQAVFSKNAKVIGQYGCRGFDTFGPFKLIGGIAKKHPTQEEIKKAVDFYQSLPQ